MAVEWTPHRFSGGALALDVANTVVLRGDPARRFDRFERAEELPRFAAAASLNRVDELGGVGLTCEDAGAALAPLVALREATDCLFRNAAEGFGCGQLASFTGACSSLLDDGTTRFGTADGPFGPIGAEIPLTAATAWSALSLLAPERAARIRICANCGWLFLDRSRNASRVWCDMAVCGNRRKASRHYGRRMAARETEHA